ncbi:NACHT domain-containing protein [Kitasatospora viridis]|uniref:NACHT domain-containing protein n=1 Tax=Kitasatospora viridis TaxID=281105 RepID=A0A561SFY8_9ACTN|nr:NACHT domain-containing protein [Kitasatospora viridis]TWF73769.1 NACHT domain-containing protein [Kitasatospora viridis]
MQNGLRQPKIRLVTGPPEGGLFREGWARLRRLFRVPFWRVHTRWLVQRGVNRARHWWRPWLATTAEVLSFALTLLFIWWAVSGLTTLVFHHGGWLGPDHICGNDSSSCEAVSGAGVPVALLAASTFGFLIWRLHRLRRYCRRRALQAPNHLVQTAGSLMDEVVGRDQLCNAIMNNLRDKHARRPHVVVGPVGAGKTALLVRLTHKLAAQGAIPVPVQLRNVQRAEDLDFAELARLRFSEIVEPVARSGDEVDRVWRWLRQMADKIVVLADGLDEALNRDHADRRDSLIRRAIRRAGEDGLPLVIASRPHDPLRAMQAAVSELDPLSDEAALHYISSSGSWRSDPTLLDRVVEAANMAESPIYLQIAKDLHQKDLLEPLWTGDATTDLLLYDSWALRADLLERWVDALISGDVHTELPLDHRTREEVVEYISALACIGLSQDRADVELRELDPSVELQDHGAPPADRAGWRPANPEWNRRVRAELDERVGVLGGPGIDVRLASTWGARMGLVYEDGDRVRFQHSIVQAFLGSRYLDRIFQEDTWPHVVRALDHGGRELLIAMTLYSRSANGGCTCCRSNKLDCPVSVMRDLLRNKAEQLLEIAEKADTLTERARATTRYAGQDWRGRPRLRAIEAYGAAVEIDSVDQFPDQQALFNRISKVWETFEHVEDAARLRTAKLVLVRQCGAAARRVAAARSRKPATDPGWPPYKRLFEIGAREADRTVREAITKEVGAGGEAAYDVLCTRLRGPDRVIAHTRSCGCGTALPNPAAPPGECGKQSERARRAQRRQAARRRKVEEQKLAQTEAQAEKKDYFSNTMRAWLLPLLVDSSGLSRHQASPCDDLDNWVQLVAQHSRSDTPLRRDPPGSTISLGVALAQGFKYAANRRLSPESDRQAREFLTKQAEELLKHSTFWFTRLTLLQALTLWALPDDVNADQPMRGHGSDPRGQVREWLTLDGPHQEEHPLVKAAEKLAVRALQTRRPERFLWIDEVAVASSVGTEVGLPGEPRAHNLWIPPSTGWSTLDPTAQQLLVDVLLLVVLAERAYRPKDLFRLLELMSREQERIQLPSCMDLDRTRLDPVRGAERTSAPGSNCTDKCRLRMCPYPARVEALRVEFSEVLCLHQRDLLRRWQPRSWLYLRFRREAAWQRGVPVAGLRHFWEQMGDRARDVKPDSTDAAKVRGWH